MVHKLTYMLDEVANVLEYKGFFKEAYEIDKISNTLDSSISNKGQGMKSPLTDTIDVQLRRALDWPIYNFKLSTEMLDILNRLVTKTNVISYKIYSIGISEEKSVPIMVVAYMDKKSKNKINFTIAIKDESREWKGFNKKIIGGDTYWIYKIENINVKKIPTNIGVTLKNIILSSYSYGTI